MYGGHFGAMVIKPGVNGWLTGAQLTRMPAQPAPDVYGSPTRFPLPIPTTLDQWTSLREEARRGAQAAGLIAAGSHAAGVGGP